MLRWTVGLLLAANALYFAWTQGYLGGLGFAPAIEREPERISNQVNPDTIRLLNGMPAVSSESSAETGSMPVAQTVEAATPDATADSAPAEPDDPPAPAETGAVAGETSIAATPVSNVATCWVADGLSVEQGNALQQVLASRSDLQGLYDFKSEKGGGRWIVYMGKLGEQTMQRKKKELREFKVEFREVRNSPLSPGLALGTFSTEEAAERGLEIVSKKGVRTARVAQERPERDYVTMTLPAVTSDQKARFDEVLAAFEGTALEPCNPAEEQQ
ncbi:hypothetical protein [Hydrogenophaga sp. 5NK40-0174]|uniref:hypothetical protein n=1 Tax=Hydrogenophaga sp. 5NK40-0174 TaxID=3127649 RepID=UPI003103B9FF